MKITQTHSCITCSRRDRDEWPKCQMAERRMKKKFRGDDLRKGRLRPFDNSATRRSPLPVTSHELQNTVSNTSDIVYNFYPFMLVAVIYVCLNKRANRPLHAVCSKFGNVTDIKVNLPNLLNLNWVLNHNNNSLAATPSNKI